MCLLLEAEGKVWKKSWKVDGEKQFAQQKQQKASPSYHKKTFFFSFLKHYWVFYCSGTTSFYQAIT